MLCQRQRLMVIFQQRHRLTGRLESQFTMCSASYDPIGYRRIGIGVFEEPQPEFGSQNPADGPVNVFF